MIEVAEGRSDGVAHVDRGNAAPAAALVHHHDRQEELGHVDPIERIYEELRRLARGYLRGERPDHTLQATALVHEAYVRLVDAGVPFQDRVHFFAVAARLMRRILVDHAKARARVKRGRGRTKVSLEEATLLAPEPAPDVLELDQPLQRLAAFDERKAQTVDETLQQEALEIYRQTLGEEHPQVAISLNNLANLRHDQGDLDAALALHQQALPEGHWSIDLTRSILGACLADLGRLEEGLPLLEQGYDGLLEKRGEENRYTVQARERLERVRVIGPRPEDIASGANRT